jgi:hypothetical protein
MASKLTTIAQQRTNLDYEMLSRKSVNWLQQKVANVRNPARLAKEISQEQSRKQRFVMRGHLYFYHYDPKYADTLPYYDIFPLTLVLEKYSDGFLGLNLHYLPVMLRAAFLDKLLDYATYDDEGVDRLRVTYDILTATKRLKAFEPCLKRYLYGQMGTLPLKVEPSEWETALFLPVERFQKARKQKVFKESIEQIKEK